MKFPSLVAAALLCAGLGSALPAHAEPSGRAIVKFRSAATERNALALAPGERVQPLAQRRGLSLSARLGPSPEVLVVSAAGTGSEELARILAADGEVEYAVPDRRRRPLALPGDPLFSTQWALQDAQPAAIRATGAWDLSTGSASVVVAVADTGVRFDHEDLAANLLPGYDFISDEDVANDGDGRDADASDPGDFLTLIDLKSPTFTGCADSPENSSWHGTRVAGIIAAAGDNARGVAGVMWKARLLPLRVLGKCGGYDSDIIAAMRWAAGLTVPGVPANSTPARIINLSLGGAGECTRPYQDLVAELDAANVLVVAAGGNDAGPVHAPANCPGVLAVGGLRNVGTKVGYSAVGPEIDISAPAGNCVTETGCLFPIDTTTNLGRTVPAANGYTNSADANVGTSFSAPLASGVAGLMLALHPQLDKTRLMQRLQAGASPFPADPALPACPAMGADNSGIDGQCNCNTASCGAGMLNAQGALAEAQRPRAVFSSSRASSAEPVRLDGSASRTAAGGTPTRWQWSIVSGPGGASIDDAAAAQTWLRATSVGSYGLRLTVQDEAGRSDSLEQTVTVDSATPAGGTQGGGTTGGGSGGGSSSGGGGGGGGSGDALLLAGLALLGLAARRRARATAST